MFIAIILEGMNQIKKLMMAMTIVILTLCATVRIHAATYRVSHVSALSWEARYDVTTRGNQITDVSHVKAKGIVGSIVKKSLSQPTRNKVTLHMTRKVGSVIYQTQLKTKVTNHRIHVTTS
ncbi:DUF5626 family protein [Lentilactobacillus kisonensis]|uniref:DUF5626 domain-containing protein n=2 Tax=Lentilactobacillus kisonensis TaxID=481722 RepID=H1LFJ3_9LACO|nr:DUF5626 family protein [Lentilactobacillus kisonensis]EHO51708.1 hypothetical protein HMPREF9104_01369 [Lentilactobacillus kisonensis F0435]